MSNNVHKMFHDLITFSSKSLEQCALESEDATSQVNEILTMLLDDANRVAAMSKETLDAIGSMQEIITMLHPSGDREVANKLAKALLDASKEDQSVNSFITPILEALQFQDRINQNMGNMIKMLYVWIDTRNRICKNPVFDESQKINFGNQLIECTSMHDEREIIRKHIEGVKPEDEAKTDVLFF